MPVMNVNPAVLTDVMIALNRSMPAIEDANAFEQWRRDLSAVRQALGIPLDNGTFEAEVKRIL